MVLGMEDRRFLPKRPFDLQSYNPLAFVLEEGIKVAIIGFTT